MDNSWVKLYRKIAEHEILFDELGLRVFIWLLTRVDKKTGVLKISRFTTSSILKLNPNTFRSVLKRLEKKYEIITSKSTNKYTEISLLNWANYQNTRFSSPHTSPFPTQTKHKQNTNKTPLIQEYKNIRIKNKDIINPNGFMSVFLNSFNEKFDTNFKDTEGRRKKLKLRLRTYSEEQILIAVENLSKSDFHVGNNDRGWRADPDFLIKSDEQIDKWLNYKKTEERPRFVKI